MKIRHVLAVLAATTALFAGAPAPAGARAPHTGDTFRRAPVTESLSQCSAEFLDGDKRLGPLRLPVLGVVGQELQYYHRTGRLSSQRFLELYWNPVAGPNGGWYYPPQSGYVLNPDGSPKRVEETLQVGQDIDRYGSEYGSFLAPEGLPYAERSIPPASLDSTPPEACNYHDYRVLKPFTVYAGPIAPWFEQPGLGRQYQLDPSLVPDAPTQGYNVQWLVDNGYLERIIPHRAPAAVPNQR
ncbi:TNT domain-containing protein [Kitasatospora sp. NPDC052896]|uniref:TNT domain-containing protein n=1 Tax=Kitasatospora sp. NPDC052896 TaxID=3364061 RepID=UPI0037C945CF